MQTLALRNLVKISKVGSFIRTAEQLNMTLSALSMQMKALEFELDVKLFDRSVRPPRLTPVGYLVVEKATKVLECENSLLDICSSDDELVGKFRVGFVSSAAVRLLPNFLENARKNLRRAEFEFETGLSAVLKEKVRTGNIDAAVVTDTEVNTEGLTQVVLRKEPFVFAAHASIANKGYDVMVENHTFFHFMPQTGIGKLVAIAMGQVNRSTKNATITLDNLETIIGCVNNGLGYTLLPKPDVERYASEFLTQIEPPSTILRSLVLLVRTDDVLAKHHDVLAEQFNLHDIAI